MGLFAVTKTSRPPSRAAGLGFSGLSVGFGRSRTCRRFGRALCHGCRSFGLGTGHEADLFPHRRTPSRGSTLGLLSGFLVDSSAGFLGSMIRGGLRLRPGSD